MSRPSLRFLSLGAGRQSTALYLLATERHWGNDGPTVAIFADTQDEPREVYDHLDRLERAFGHIVPILRVTAGRLLDKVLKVGAMPAYTAGVDGRGGPVGRQCTRDYKIIPIEREVRRLLGVRPRCAVPAGVWAESWFGISADEASRMKDARRPWLKNRYPLAMEMGWRTRDCELLNEARGFSAPKSACLYCPYTSADRWRTIKAQHPAEFAQAVAVDEAIRQGVFNTTGPVFLHRSLVPLRDVDFSSAEDRGQGNLFADECEGVCGV